MTTSYGRRQFLWFGSAALGSSLLLKACSAPQSTETAAPSASPSASASGSGSLKAAIALPGPINDKAWNQAGYSGLEEIKKQLGIETAYQEKVKDADQAEVLSDFARRGFNLVYAHGGQFDAAIKQVAAQFPDRKSVV